MINPAHTVYVIAGPTAAGKTAVAIALAKRLGTAIISADSRQCYHEMAIGTARPSSAELAEVKHYFISEFPVRTELTAADFERLALGYLAELFKTHNVAVVCGGTGLYIKALCEGLDRMPATDEQAEQEIETAYHEHGMAWLQQAVQKEDPAFYAQGEIHNPARMLRALAFVRTTGRSILEFRSGSPKERPFRVVKVALQLPRQELYERINGRVDTMMAQGLEDEVRQLYPLRALKNLQTVGYAELFDFFEGKCSRTEAVDKIKQHTRNYAKRQMTWFKKDTGITWLNADDPDVVDKVIALGSA